MQNIALSWLVYRLTGSVFLLGLIGFTSQIPTFILSPFAGVLTDRYNRLRIMIVAQSGFMFLALVMTLLVLFKLIAVWHIIFLSLLSGIIFAMDAPARQSLVIDLIDDPRDLGNAIALNSAIFNAARLIGPAVAGVIIAASGEGICFLINTVSFVAVIAALLNIKVPVRKSAARSLSFRENFLEGFQYTFRTWPIRNLILLLTVISLFGISYIVLLPAYTDKILHGSSDILGYLMSSMGAGALLAALYMASRKSNAGLENLLSYSVVVLGIMITAASFSGIFLISSLLFFIAGCVMILALASVNTMIQTITEEDKRGRVMSFYAMALMGTSPIGSLLSGSIASKAGIREAMMISGFLTIGAGVWFSLNSVKFHQFLIPSFPESGRTSDVADEIP